MSSDIKVGVTFETQEQGLQRKTFQRHIDKTNSILLPNGSGLYYDALRELERKNYPNLFSDNITPPDTWRAYLEKLDRIRIINPNRYRELLKDKRIFEAEGHRTQAKKELAAVLRDGKIISSVLNVKNFSKEKIKAEWWGSIEANQIDAGSWLWRKNEQGDFCNDQEVVLINIREFQRWIEGNKESNRSNNLDEINHAVEVIKKTCEETGSVVNRGILAEALEKILGNKLKHDLVESHLKGLPLSIRNSRGRLKTKNKKPFLNLSDIDF